MNISPLVQIDTFIAYGKYGLLKGQVATDVSILDRCLVDTDDKRNDNAMKGFLYVWGASEKKGNSFLYNFAVHIFPPLGVIGMILVGLRKHFPPTAKTFC